MPLKRKKKRDILEIHQQRLRLLKEQQARLGIHTPPHIIMEIQDVEEQIRELRQATPPDNPNEGEIAPERVTTCPQCKAPLKLKPKNEEEQSSYVIYSVRVGTSLECGHCSTIIPNQFKEEAKRGDVRPGLRIGKGMRLTGRTVKTGGVRKPSGGAKTGVRPKNTGPAVDRAFLKRLREVIHENFTLVELEGLVDELSGRLGGSHRLYFDDLAGNTRSSKARELVQWCMRRQVLEELKEAVLSLRPTVEL